MKPFALLAALALLAPAAGAAQTDEAPAPAASPACFRMSQIQNHRIGDDVIYFRVGFKEVWRATTAGACTAGAMRDETLIMSTPGSKDLICGPLDLDLKIRVGDHMTSPCIVRELVRLSPEEIEAIPEKLKP